MFGVEPFSEQHWDVIDQSFAALRAAGVDTVFTPIFTPPIDTHPRLGRMTIQLLGAERSGAGYRFDMGRLNR